MLSTKIKNYIPYAFLIVFSIPLFFINVRDKHSLGDDFAQYIKEADNISKGRPYYESNYVFNEVDKEYAPPQYPVGYPLLLVPAVSMYGIAIRPMLYTNSLIIAALLLALYTYFRKYAESVIAVCLSLLIVYSNVILDVKGSILSDIPCVLFTVLYLLLRNSETFSVRRILLLIGSATMVILIRSQGLVLLAAEGAYFLIYVLRQLRTKQFSVANAVRYVSVKVIVGTVFLFLVVNNLVFSAPGSTLSYYMTMSTHRMIRMRDLLVYNLNYVYSILVDFFHYPTDNQLLRSPADIAGHVVFVFALLGFIFSVRKKTRVDDLFFVLMCLMVLVIPVHQGSRVLFAVFPVYVYYAYISASTVLHKMTKRSLVVPAVVTTAIYLALGMDIYKKYSNEECIGCVPSNVPSVIFDYVKNRINDRDIIVFPRPRLLTLYTNKRSVVYASKATDEENKKKFDELQVKYFIPWFDGNQKKFMRDNYKILDSVNLGDAFLYRVR